MSASSASRCELTETYSPTAIDIAPAASPETPAIRTVWLFAEDAATPSIRLDVDTIASFDPRTAARSQLVRPLRWDSRCETRFMARAYVPQDRSGLEEQSDLLIP